jgi:hypothetical protein
VVWFHGSYLLLADAPKGQINMKLVERISTQNATQAAQTPPRTSLMTSSPRRQRDTMADGFQQLKLALHNQLFETLDVSRPREPRAEHGLDQGHPGDHRGPQ